LHLLILILVDFRPSVSVGSQAVACGHAEFNTHWLTLKQLVCLCFSTQEKGVLGVIYDHGPPIILRLIMGILVLKKRGQLVLEALCA